MPTARNYPNNCWYIIATDVEVEQTPLSRQVLDQRIVVFRDAHGGPTALEDRCAHRLARLSQGKLVGGEIECPYHGFRYDSSGRCTHIPIQSTVPSRMRVRAFPACQHGRWIWVWMGDPERADRALLPQIPWFTDEAFLQVRGYAELACNYMLLQENVIDLTHLPYVHADAGQEGWSQQAAEVRVQDGRVTFSKRIVRQPISPAFGAMMGIEAGKAMNRTDWGTFASPACHYAGSDYENPSTGNEQAGHYQIRTMHATTPVSANRCHYWWAFAQDFALDQPTEAIEGFLKNVVAQDKNVLEALQSTIDADAAEGGSPEVLISSDRAVVEARRVLQTLLDAEAGASVLVGGRPRVTAASSVAN